MNSPIWLPHHAHSSDGSLLDGASSASNMVKRCKELGYTTCTLSEHGNLLSTVKLEKECKKRELKPIFANEFYICDNAEVKDPQNRKLAHLVVLATNPVGWTNLVRLNNAANTKFYYKPRIDFDMLAKYSEGLLCFSGHPGSQMANIFFSDLNAYGAETVEDVKGFIRPDWVQAASNLADKYRSIFKDNFFLEVQLFDQVNMPAQVVLAQGLRYLSKKMGIPCVATADSHYAKKEDARDQRALLCISLKTTLKKVQSQLNSGEEFGLDGFFKSSQYYIPSQEEMQKWHTKEELDSSLEIASRCENYSILNKPKLPSISNNSVQELRQKCRDGWRNKIASVISKEEQQKYVDRINGELKVIEDANLSDYFLIVNDYVKAANNKGILTGPGRGSAAGCLVSYLLDITQVNPIENNLIFERFYNAGRNSPGHIQYPDIDTDFEATRRDEVIDYIRSRYGENCVANICTIGRMMGRGVVKDVFRIYDTATYDEVNRITDWIPDEAKIADELQSMKESGEQPSIILWALQNHAKELKEWVELQDGKITGKYGHIFAQAMRLEGTARSIGKHASGLVISSQDLFEYCPMVYDKRSSHLSCGLELEDLEPYGIVKFDILGLSALNKVSTAISLIEK